MKSIKLEKEENLNEPLNSKKIKNVGPLSAKSNIYKNLIVLCVTYLLQFASIFGLSNLQSSINDNIGIVSLLTSSISNAISCLILPSILRKYFGFKWPIIISQLFFTIYIGANFYPKAYTLIPSSVLHGIAMSLLWTFQGSFIVELGKEYSNNFGVKLDLVLVKFFGIFTTIFQISNIQRFPILFST